MKIAKFARPPMAHIVFIIAFALVTACSDVPNRGVEKVEASSQEEWLAHYSNPQYGEVQDISGKFWWFFETSEINLCGSAKDCQTRRNVDGSAQQCWVEFAKPASSDRQITPSKEGSYWLNGRGRIAVLPGSFGHLGQYTCQVEILEVKDFEELETP